MKNTFSERMGYKNPREVIQSESMDDSLRTAIWNAIYELFFKLFMSNDYYSQEYGIGRTFIMLWIKFFELKLDEAPGHPYDCLDFIKKYFFNCQWYEVYDFIEFLISCPSTEDEANTFIPILNQILEEELSGYRVISKRITPIISKPEVISIESALQINEIVSFHINEALKLLADKVKPDFRNSIKESISSVEAIARLITGKPKAELGTALTEIEKAGNLQIHGALKSGFSSLYGWTSDAQGIRHSLVDAPSLSQEDAVYMLVACSAFVNYLYAKTLKVGLELSLK